MNLLHFVYPFISRYLFDLFPHFGYYDWCFMNICLQVFGGHSGHIGLYASFLRSARLFSILHSHQRCFAFCSQTPEELEDVSDLEEDHEVRSHTSLQTEGKTDRVCHLFAGEISVLCPFLVNPGSLSQLGLLDLEMLLQSQGEEPPHAGEAAGGNDFLPLESTQGGCVWSGSESTHNTLDLYSSHGNIKVKCAHVCL